MCRASVLPRGRSGQLGGQRGKPTGRVTAILAIGLSPKTGRHPTQRPAILPPKGVAHAQINIPKVWCRQDKPAHRASVEAAFCATLSEDSQ